MSYNTQAPDIDFKAVCLFLYYFRSHVEWTAEHLRESLFFLEETCEAKISQLYVRKFRASRLLWHNENILWLYVSVYDVELVHVVDGQKKLLHHARSLPLAHPLDFYDVSVELSSCDQLRDDVEVNLISKGCKRF